jgi:hypothetical protein
MRNQKTIRCLASLQADGLSFAAARRSCFDAARLAARAALLHAVEQRFGFWPKPL